MLTLHAEGAQVYECKAGADGKLAWAFREPIATLLADGKTVGRHYAGPNWEHGDGSAVVGKAIGNAPGATANDIPWLKLEVTSRRGSGVLTPVTTVQRINTHGGKLEGSCDKAGALQKRALLGRLRLPAQGLSRRVSRVALVRTARRSSAVRAVRRPHRQRDRPACVPVSASRASRGLVDMGRKRRHALDQGVKILRVEHEQPGLARRRHRAAALGPVQQRDLAEERAVGKPDALARQFDLDLAGGDEIHRGGGIAPPHQDFALLDGPGPQQPHDVGDLGRAERCENSGTRASMPQVTTKSRRLHLVGKGGRDDRDRQRDHRKAR